MHGGSPSSVNFLWKASQLVGGVKPKDSGRTQKQSCLPPKACFHVSLSCVPFTREFSSPCCSHVSGPEILPHVGSTSSFSAITALVKTEVALDLCVPFSLSLLDLLVYCSVPSTWISRQHLHLGQYSTDGKNE